MEESKEPTTADNEDVEAHGLVDRPPAEDREANTEEPEVEGHGLVERPPDMRPVDM